MTRQDLEQIVEKHDGDHLKIREELLTHFQTEEGQKELRNAPHVSVESNNDFPLQTAQIERVVDLLMQEVIRMIPQKG